MKKTIFCLFALCLIFGCELKDNKSAQDETLLDMQELQELYTMDQEDRSSKDSMQSLLNRNPQLVRERDAARRERVYELLDSNLVRTSKDYERAGMIFQHGLDTTASSMAVKLMQTAIEMDSSINKWLLAAAIDRDLMWRKEPQIFGTQYIVQLDNSIELYKMDTTQITDQERIEHGVPTLSELLREKE